MSTIDSAPPAVDKLPLSAWVLAWLFLLGQVAWLFARGVNSSDALWVVVSMAASALVVRWFADGVLRARTVRLVIVWLALSATISFSFVALAIDATGATAADLVAFACEIAQLIALGVFCTTDYFKDRRAHPNMPRAALAPLLLIAVATGLLGGLTAPAGGDAPPMHLKVGL